MGNTQIIFGKVFVLYPIIIKIRPHRQSYQINYHSLNLISSSLDDNIPELFPVLVTFWVLMLRLQMLSIEEKWEEFALMSDLLPLF